MAKASKSNTKAIKKESTITISNKVRKTLQQLSKLLALEKSAHLEQYNNTIINTSLDYRTTQGMSWYPLYLQKKGYGLGDKPYVIVERTRNVKKNHQFKAGKVVLLFAKKHPLSQERKSVKGVVNYINGAKMKIILHTNVLPDWLNSKNKLGIDLYFDERSFTEMEKTLDRLRDTENERLAELLELMYGSLEKTAKFHSLPQPIVLTELNDSQNLAVNQILAAQDIAVVHGPPGTGKTTTLVEAITLLSQLEGNTLVCAPSNPAVDLLVERLADKGLNVLRVGNISRVEEKLLIHTVEAKLTELPAYENLRTMRHRAIELRKAARKLDNKNRVERAKRKNMFREAIDLNDQSKMLERYLIDQMVKNADVVACTLVSAANDYLATAHFETLVIDEAAQALEPATWIPIQKAKRVVLVGDPFQLPPTVVSNKAAQKGLGVTLLEKQVRRLSKVNLLTTQYRMHQDIMGFSNQYFYEGKLWAAPLVRRQRLSFKSEYVQEAYQAVEFIDTAGKNYWEKRNNKTQSYYNPEEYYIIGQHLDLLLAKCAEPPSVAIIAPYKEQTTFIEKQLKEHEEVWQSGEITVNTIDAFQGQERDVVYISMVRSNKKGHIGFLKDYRRMNVAMTRAKKKLVLVGDSNTLQKDPFYKAFLEYCQEIRK